MDDIDTLTERIRADLNESLKGFVGQPNTPETQAKMMGAMTYALANHPILIPISPPEWPIYSIPVDRVRHMKSNKWWRRRNKKLWRALHSTPSPVIHIRTFEEFQQVMSARS